MIGDGARSVGGTALKQDSIATVTDSYGLRRRRKHHLHVGTLVAEYLTAVSAMMLS